MILEMKVPSPSEEMKALDGGNVYISNARE